MRITGQQGIADFFGMSRETIDTWQRQGLPVAVRGGPGVASEYDSAKCLAWLIDRELKKVAHEKPQDRLARVQADKIEMENAERRMQLIPADLVAPRLQAFAAYARCAGKEMIARLARDLPDTTNAREEILTREFEAYLHRLADSACAGADSDDDDDGD